MRQIFALIAVSLLTTPAFCAEFSGGFEVSKNFASTRSAASVGSVAGKSSRQLQRSDFSAAIEQRIGEKRLTNQLIARAKSQVNTMYRFGGTSPETGFDCSGFIGWIFSEVTRAPLPRTADSLFQLNSPSVAGSDLRPGDLLFYRTFGNRVSHVSMYIGNRTFIHATRAGQPLRTENMDLPYWRQRFAGAKRVLGTPLVSTDAAPVVSIPNSRHQMSDQKIFASTF
jgi:cell wall-associated NlpC family hydrolase